MVGALRFYQHQFLNSDGSAINASNEVIVEKFKAITGIGERRYAKKTINTSDIAFFAAEKAIESANINREDIDYIIIAHNYGDVKHSTEQSDTVPSIASRVKHLLKIKNPKCVGYDLLFGCPGWVEGVIQANAFIKAGIAKTCFIEIPFVKIIYSPSSFKIVTSLTPLIPKTTEDKAISLIFIKALREGTFSPVICQTTCSNDYVFLTLLSNRGIIDSSSTSNFLNCFESSWIVTIFSSTEISL